MSDQVGNTEDRFSHNEAQISSNTHFICSSASCSDSAGDVTETDRHGDVWPVAENCG